MKQLSEKSDMICAIRVLSENVSTLGRKTALIVANEMTVRDVMKGIYPHPTLTEAFGKLSQQIFMKSMMKGRGK
jgi:pyruvate/2-oxoglutarate dehydrogenase complex dihydrolipoamide dehydrogenase (E3) component